MAAGADALLVTVRGWFGVGGTRRAWRACGFRRRRRTAAISRIVTFDGAPAEFIAGDASEALEVAALATSAYLLGAMDRVFGITLEYLKTREQFGRKIGTFQALQHRSADLKIQLELTRATVDRGGAHDGRNL